MTPDAEDGRRYPSTIGGLCYIGVLAVAVIAIVIAAVGQWRIGVYLLATALLVGAILRAVLPERDAGMLAVRGKVLDSCLLAGIGTALIVLVSGLPGGN